MSKKSRDKGKVGEREVALLAREAGFLNAERDWRTPQLNGDIRGIGDIHLEVRRRESLCIEAWCKEVEAKAAVPCPECDGDGERDLWPDGPKAGVACETCGGTGTAGRLPVVAWRRSAQPWRASLPLIDLLRLLAPE